ncbi:MAG: hypothetical protein M3071_25075 [Actinomycetota bacterium]|nr:hypothetical protein [Actinomycetota bacterium]
MTTDEQLIERLRASMNAATTNMLAPGNLLDGISPRRRRGVRLPSAGGLVVAVATVSTIVVTLVMIIALGRARTPSTAAPATAPAPVATTLGALRSELAILRRPQRAVDKLPGWGIAAEVRPNCSNCLNVAKVLRRQTRLLATVLSRPINGGPGHTRERIYLVLGTVPRSWGHGLISGWRQRGRAIDGLHLSLVGLTHRQPHFPQPEDELLNPILRAVPAQTLTPQAVMITSFATVGVVPDGVTRVKWELANPGQTKPATVYPRVRGNVAIAPWTPAPRSTALINEQSLVGATWYGAGGHAIATFNATLGELNRAHGS